MPLPPPADIGIVMTTRKGFLVAIVLTSLIWGGIDIGVAFVATPAKFLSTMASLPILIDIGRKTFAVLEKVDCIFAAILFALGLAAPALKRQTRAWLVLPTIPFLVDFLWLRPILDAEAVKVVSGLAPSDGALHVAYACLVALQICLSILSAAIALTLLAKSGAAVLCADERLDFGPRMNDSAGLTR
jgi:hypothetical protein